VPVVTTTAGALGAFTGTQAIPKYPVSQFTAQGTVSGFACKPSRNQPAVALPIFIGVLVHTGPLGPFITWEVPGLDGRPGDVSDIAMKIVTPD